MSRLHSDPVEVRTRVEAAGPVPDQFLWRGQLYLVRDVLARWTESGSWWRGAAVRAAATGTGNPGATGTPTGVDDRETHWWRVEAGSGRIAAMSGGQPVTGVYDLCLDWTTGSWSLKRVMD